MKNNTHFSLWVFDSDVKDALLFSIPLISTKHYLFPFDIIVRKFEGLKGRYFYGQPRAALSLATPPYSIKVQLMRRNWTFIAT